METLSLDQELERLRIIYSEIIQGYSYSEESGLYIKHLTEIENGELSRKKANLFLKFKKEGLLSEEEKLNQLIEADIWSKEKEEQILEYRYFISDNEKNLSKIIPQQHAPIIKVINETRLKLANLLFDRQEAIGATANKYAEKESLQYLILLSAYKDPLLKERFFDSLSDFDDLEEEEIDKYLYLIKDSFKEINEENLKKIAVLPFFINYLSYCKDSMFHFLGKPIVELTTHQMNLLSLGSRNLSILNGSTGEPPSLLGDVKVIDVVNWYDQQYSIILGKRDTKKA